MTYVIVAVHVAGNFWTAHGLSTALPVLCARHVDSKFKVSSCCMAGTLRTLVPTIWQKLIHLFKLIVTVGWDKNAISLHYGVLVTVVEANMGGKIWLDE